MATDSPPRLWAAYLEMVHGDGESRARMQWVFVPPVPDDVAPDGMTPVPHAGYYYRRQNKVSHKSTWKITHLNTPQKHQEMLKAIADAEMRGWRANPVVTCEVHPLEMRELALEGWKTPYRFLNRLTRVASAKHGYKI